jgi:hypothetical protein
MAAGWQVHFVGGDKSIYSSNLIRSQQPGTNLQLLQLLLFHPIFAMVQCDDWVVAIWVTCQVAPVR